jgi:hypothetical protein
MLGDEIRSYQAARTRSVPRSPARANVISKTLIGHYTVGEYLGEPFPETEPGYRPITNVPTAGPPTYGVLYVEVHHAASEGEPEGWDSVPAGQEGEVEVKGEALMIKT